MSIWIYYSLSPLVFLISLIAPKSERLWCFGAWFGEEYSDSARYLYEYVTANHPEIEAVWVSKNQSVIESLRSKGRRVVPAFSLCGLITQIRARHFFCTTNSKDFYFAALTPRNKIIQLWHGSPLKKIGFDAPDSHPLKRVIARIRSVLTDKYLLVVSPSPLFDDKFASAFGLGKECIVRCGYPRNDGLFISQERKIEIRHAFGVGDSQRLVVYLPTHRSEGREADVVNTLIAEFKRLDNQISAAGLHVVVKPHFRDAWLIAECDGAGVAVTHRLRGYELYQVLASCDGLITDYSSVIFDFDITGKPVYFLSPDIEWYRSQGRGLYFSYEDFAGKYATSAAELLSDIYAGNSHLKDSLGANSDRSGDYSRKLLEALWSRVGL